MRSAAVLLLALGIPGSAPALETAHRLADSDAPHLALARVELLQPRDPDAPRWAEWEALRLTLLVGLRHNGEALERAAALPAGMPRPALRQSLRAAARAAVAEGQGATARAYASRLLWQLEPAPNEARAARLLVIESYAAERQGEAAFRAMLRFEQDYRPLARGVAEQFVERLLDLGMEKEAVNWLAGLDDASALKLQLRLRTGLADADAVIAQARAQLAKGGGPDYWQVLAAAAAKQGNGTLRIEALERLLNHGGGNGARVQPTPAAELWQVYQSEARVAANAGRLLAGDDTAWLDYAARRLGASPQQSRALYAHVARDSAARDTRQIAQLQLVFSLYQSGLDRAALRLFGDDGADSAGVDPQARYLLGNIAEARNAPLLAVRYWQGLAPPPDASAEEWAVRLATMQWRSGAAEAAAGTLRALAKRAQPLPDPAAGRALALAREMLAAAKPDLAQEMLAALLPLAGRSRAREMLYALGGAAESAAQFARAADYFLRSALALDSPAPDAPALQARLAAAMNLARAGYRDDARAQFQWVLKNSKDAAHLDTARRELSRL
ncbi:MAG: hypothetical protein A3I02_13785 [Betaproteobacteria bacterium RIFCSPLOWO2_02_FULL_67_26]|nr:MAG: hypothetical protein A3I02_13785 [Betaproteobacteria bacterium RIFCSPLOWO2_02_FULL_67_26]